MRRIFKIAKAELFTLFYSPIAWMILVVFGFQSGLVFVDLLQGILKSQIAGFGNQYISASIFSGQLGLFTAVQKYLHLYMPLLTMGLMSRELSSGSIKLLYSSPVTSSQIIKGKFLAMMGYGLLLMSVLLIYILIAAFTVENFEFTSVMVGFLSLYLLICAYSAIGLFMSCLTSYQVVAALGTLVLLSVLSYMNQIWQDVEFVRDLTYWLSISGRCNEMINGLLCSEDVLYFAIVTCLFLVLSVLKLQSDRTRASFSSVWTKYTGVVVCALLLGYISSRPIFMGYYDATVTKRNTLTPESQKIMSKLDGDLTITTYVNLLDREYYHGIPNMVNNDKERLKQYIRFKPETKMKYVYYYDKHTNNPWVDHRFPNMSLKEQAEGVADQRDLKFSLFLSPEALKKSIDLTDEGNTFVRLVERENGQKAFLRIYDDMLKFPGEAEVSAVFKRMVMKLPRIAFLQGHEERKIEGDRKYDYTLFASVKTFRYALTNQGCEVETLDLSGDNEIPAEVDIIVLGDMKHPLDATESKKLDAYVAKGGNLLISLKPGSKIMESYISQFGIKTVPGMLVQPKEDIVANMVLSRPTAEAVALNEYFKVVYDRRSFVGMIGAAGLEMTEDKGFHATPILRTDTIKLYASPDTIPTWSEMETIDFVNDSVSVNSAIGEKTDAYTTAMSLTRMVGDKEQRIMILGDADFISNGGMNPESRRFPVANFNMVPGMFHWLSYGKVPVDVSRPGPTDNIIFLTKGSFGTIKIGLLWVVPGIVLIFGTIMLIRRKRK